MKKVNIINKLECAGYYVVSTRFSYWDTWKVELEDGNYLVLARTVSVRNSSFYGISEDFPFKDVMEAISMASNGEVRSMDDYYSSTFMDAWSIDDRIAYTSERKSAESLIQRWAGRKEAQHE